MEDLPEKLDVGVSVRRRYFRVNLNCGAESFDFTRTLQTPLRRRGRIGGTMKTSVIALFVLAFLGPPAVADTQVDPVVESVSMFKNGLALVVARVDSAQAGELVWNDPPAPVHGTFFVEGADGLTVRATLRKTAAPADEVTGNLQADLAGCKVTVSLSGKGPATPPGISGTVWTPPPPERRFAWSRRYEPTDGSGSYGYGQQGHRDGLIPGPVSRTGAFLILEGADGLRHYIASNEITMVRRDAAAATLRTVEKPVLLFDTKKAGPLRISYLTKGMAWVPSYQVDLRGTDKLHLRLSAVVKNELTDLAATELRLISGFPGIRFAHVNSPLAPGVTLAEFFSRASQEGGASRGNVMSQQILFNNARMNEGNTDQPLPAAEPGAGAADIHYQSIGKHSLAEGDALSLDVAQGDAACERVVEWKLPDFRDDRGRMQNARAAGRSLDEADPYDAVQFLNPLKMPMTTAAATITESGRFTGQTMSGWTAPGQQVVLRITKALTIYTEHSEREEEGQREIVFITGDPYRRTRVAGELKVRNDRAEPAKVVIRGQFSGDLIEAEGEPAKSLRKEGVWSVNPRRELEWTLTLMPGETQALKYRYSVLVHN